MKLVIYTRPGCHLCEEAIAAAEALIPRFGFSLHEVNIELDDDAAELVMRVNGGNRTVPTLVFPNGTALTNPSVSQVKAELAA